MFIGGSVTRGLPAPPLISQQPVRQLHSLLLSSLVGFSICIREEYDGVRQYAVQKQKRTRRVERLHQFLPKLIESILPEMKSGFHACRSGGCAADLRGGVHLMQKRGNRI